MMNEYKIPHREIMFWEHYKDFRLIFAYLYYNNHWISWGSGYQGPALISRVYGLDIESL